MKKVAIVVGHTEDSPGACSPHNISCEWEFNFGIATELCVIRDLADIYLYDTYKGGYNAMVARNVSQMNQKDYDLTIELHYNSATPKAHGAEVLYHHKDSENWDELRIGKDLLSRMEEMGFRNRGVKHISSRDRGYAAVHKPKGNSILFEPFFGSNKEDCERIRDGYWDFINIMEQFIIEL